MSKVVKLLLNTTFDLSMLTGDCELPAHDGYIRCQFDGPAIYSIDTYVHIKTWTLTAETNRQLAVFEMGCLRRIMGVTCRDHILNSDIKAKLKLEDDIVEKNPNQQTQIFLHFLVLGLAVSAEEKSQ